MGLDRTALQNVRIDGALCQEADPVQLVGLFGKDINKLFANDLALCLGIRDTGQLIQEAVDGVNIDQIGVHLVAEDLDNLFWLALAEQAMVDMDTGQLFADCLDQQGRDDGRIHTAGQGQKYFLITNLLAECGKLLINKGLRQHRCGDALHRFRAFIICHRSFLQLIEFKFPADYSTGGWFFTTHFDKNWRSFHSPIAIPPGK